MFPSGDFTGAISANYWHRLHVRSFSNNAFEPSRYRGILVKVLVAYDGSRGSEAAIDDLILAGLPDHGTAHVLSVAEISVPQPKTTPDVDLWLAGTRNTRHSRKAAAGPDRCRLAGPIGI